MSYKDTNITNAGTSIRYGADDMEVIARLFNGVTSGPFPVKIKSTNKWGFWDGIAYFRNQADTQDMTIRGPVTMTANRDLTLPSVTANDTLAAIGLQNVWSVKQQLEAGTLIKQTSAPSNPPSNYHHLYVNGSGQLVKRNSSGAEVVYDTLGTGSNAALRDYSARVFNTGGTYFAVDSTGAIISQGTTFETVAQAALNLKGSILFSGPTTLACSGSFAGLDVLDKTHVVIERGCTITVPNAYTSYLFRMLNVDRWIIESNGVIDEAGTPARNWNAFFVDTTTTTIENSHIQHAHVQNASTVVRMRATGASAMIRGCEFMNINGKDCRKFATWETASSGKIDMNMFMACVINALAGVTTNGFKDITGDMNELHGCMFMDNSGTMSEFNILSSATNTMIVGGNLGMMGTATYSDASLSTTYINAGLGLEVDSSYLKVRTPSGTFPTTIVNSAQSANRNLTIPLLANGNDLFATVGINNHFSTTQEIIAGEVVMEWSRDSKTVGARVGNEFWLKDSLDAWQLYGAIKTEITDNTSLSEDSVMRFYTSTNGSMVNVLTVGGAAIEFADPPVVIKGDGMNDLLYLYRTDNTLFDSASITYDLENSTNTRTTYAITEGYIDSPTAGSELGGWQINLLQGASGIVNICDFYTTEISAKRRIRAEVDGSDRTLECVRTDNVVGNEVDLRFYAEDSTNASVQLGEIDAEIVTNTAGAVDSKLEFKVRQAGSINTSLVINKDGALDIGGSNRLRINDTGLTSQKTFTVPDVTTMLAGYANAGTFTAAQIIKTDTTNAFAIFRDNNANGSEIAINFDAKDSAGNQDTYARIRGYIIDNTSTSENGGLRVYTNLNNSTVLRMEIDDDNATFIQDPTQTDALYLFRASNAVSDGVDLNFDLNNSVATRTTYCDLRSQIRDATSGSEDARFQINVMRAGTKIEQFRVEDNQIFVINPVNTVGANQEIRFQGLSSTSVERTYAGIRGEIVTNTNAAEAGKIEFFTMDAGSVLEKMLLQSNGALDLLAGQMTITRDGNATFLDLYRTDNSIGNQVELSFIAEDSTNAKTTYAKIYGEIEDATNGSEDGSFKVDLMTNGGMVSDIFAAYNNGTFQMFRSTSTNFNEIGLTFVALDTGAARQDYGTFTMELMDTTAASEDGQFDWDLVRGGSTVRVMKLDNTGKLTVGRDTSNQRGIPSLVQTNANDVVFNTSTAENTLFSTTVKGNIVGVDGHIKVNLGGYILQNQATGTTYTFRIKVGGTTVWQDTLGGSIAQSATKRPWYAELVFMPANQSSTSARMYGFMMLNDTTAPTTGIGSTADATIAAQGAIRAEAISWTFANDTTVSVTCQMSVSNAATEIMMDSNTIELAPT